MQQPVRIAPSILSADFALLGEEEVARGDWVLIHVGFAMSKIDEHEAQETLQALQGLGTTYSDEVEMFHQSQIL